MRSVLGKFDQKSNAGRRLVALAVFMTEEDGIAFHHTLQRVPEFDGVAPVLQQSLG
jgi:hypothetical protein